MQNMWSATPDLKISQSVGPTSPPETPRTASPVFGRKNSPPLQGAFPSQTHPRRIRPMAPPPLATGERVAFNPFGGPSFTHPRAIRPDQLSPRTTSCSSSSSASEADSSDDDSEPAGAARPVTPEHRRYFHTRAPPPPHSSRMPQFASRVGGSRPIPIPVIPERVVSHEETNFTIEELSDFADSDYEREDVIRPDYIEYAESNRSRSRSRPRPPELDQAIMYNLNNLNCSDDSDETDIDEAEYREFLIKRREEKRKRRMTSGSIGKRTISESIGSDSDREDLKSWIGAEEAGSSARRLRRRIGDRRSLQFTDPPPPRIDELDEPESCDDEIILSESLARELPYYQYVSMEVDSPP
ncbi:hypothetical protein QBC38DRAFT_479921 [Podospora fimiseda]|uniref:Uncharacterized protein n=1 Tax=Podospora fimiseda TaxID=252190 RepID=A0AAN7BNI1_9PEZI|nr:hypothetical protein QBC38DRAFT_479921 [Podospora fimiseda]